MPAPDFQVSTVDGVIAVSGCLDFSTATQVLGAVNEQMLAIPTTQSDTQVINNGLSSEV